MRLRVRKIPLLAILRSLASCWLNRLTFMAVPRSVGPTREGAHANTHVSVLRTSERPEERVNLFTEQDTSLRYLARRTP